MRIHILVCGLVALSCLHQMPAEDLRVRVQIDGQSQLVIKKDRVFWRHVQWMRPGTWQENKPTMIDGYAWYPVWADNIHFNPGDSVALKVSTKFSTNGVSLLVHSARGSVSIKQQPTPATDFTLVVEFFDPEAGADEYDVTLLGTSLVVLPNLNIRVVTVAISFLSDTNTQYQVQYLPTPSSTQWVNWGTPVLGVGTNVILVDVDPEHPYRLFRVLPLP